MIQIVDYGVGNVGSISNMIAKIGGKSLIAKTVDDISRSSKLILPGVGAFDDGMRKLSDSGMLEAIQYKALHEKIPVLGICLGAQMMTNQSEEGELPGLGWFDANTIRFNFQDAPNKLPLPNIGWREVTSVRDCPLLTGFVESPRFYFVHSFYMNPAHGNEQIVSMKSNYGIEFACGLSRENIHCVQFHPEKSHAFGMKFFKNFLEMA